MILNMDVCKSPIFRPWASQESSSTNLQCPVHSKDLSQTQKVQSNSVDRNWLVVPSVYTSNTLNAHHRPNDIISNHMTNNQSLLNSFSYNNIILQQMIGEKLKKADQQKKQRPKKFQCPHCRVSFTNNGQLKGHIRIHTGERPFKCDFSGCDKTFTRNEELTRHKRIHTGLKPFSCPMCCKSFGRKDHLKKHTRTHQRLLTMSAAMLPSTFSAPPLPPPPPPSTASLLHGHPSPSCYQLSYYPSAYF